MIKENKDTLKRISVVAACVLVNVLLSFVAYKLKLPMYLDTAGTIFAAVVGGFVPGVTVGVLTNLFSNIINSGTVYYVLISVLIAMITTYLKRRGYFDHVRRIVLYIIAISLMSAILGTCFQWILTEGSRFSDVAALAEEMNSNTGLGLFFCTMLIEIGLNFVDKGLMTILALVAYRLVSDKFKEFMLMGSWKQKPLSPQEIKEFRKKTGSYGKSLRIRITVMLTLAALGIATIMGWISVSLYYQASKADYTRNATNAARFASQVVDPDKVDEYLENGHEEEGFDETLDLLYRVRESYTGIKYVYVLKVERDGCHFIFDLDAEDEPGYEPGEVVPFEEAFDPYLSDLFAGREVSGIAVDSNWGYVSTTYWPVKNAQGRTVCYACADAELSALSDYVKNYLVKVLLVFSGFFVMILGIGIWISGQFLINPINSMAGCADDFMKGGEENAALDAKVKKLESLKINTNDEVEKLYQSLCKMASGTVEQMKDIRHYADATAQMQNGLIITMADMVENRDSDTGAHIQKTAEYVRIILEGLKKNGYYPDKLTPKYISDVIMSAPLHDVGKINIPDAVLNKPGKLTDEEFKIMKTHTTAGKKIMERAISTVQGENYLKEARNMAAYHHERWDGKGYPEGLRGEVIPLSARVMSVADVFDALTSPRIYKPAFPMEKAIDIIKEGAGAQFDPKCVEVFLDSISEVKLVHKKYHNV